MDARIIMSLNSMATNWDAGEERSYERGTMDFVLCDPEESATKT